MEVWKFAKVNPPQKSTHHNMPKTQQYMDFLSLEALQEDVFGSVKGSTGKGKSYFTDFICRHNNKYINKKIIP